MLEASRKGFGRETCRHRLKQGRLNMAMNRKNARKKGQT